MATGYQISEERGRDRLVRSGTRSIGRSGKARRFRHPDPFIHLFRQSSAALALEEKKRRESEKKDSNT